MNLNKIHEQEMTELRETLLDIIAEYANVDAATLTQAVAIRDLPVDSVAMLGVLDELEERFEIRITADLREDTTLDEFEALIARLIAERDA